MIWSTLSSVNFSGTIGFGKTFFNKLNLSEKCPEHLHDMPDHYELGDHSPYSLQQTDMILQLASNNYSINRMVLQNDWYLHYPKKYATKNYRELSNSNHQHTDIIGTLIGWAKITDAHSGFHRSDKRNLMGFYDGISNPDRLMNNGIWISEAVEGKEFADGTYMVFQKIEHDLNEWHKLDTSSQENWVGRSKATGLLLGTLSLEVEKKLISELHSDDPRTRRQTLTRWTRLFDQQRDPKKRFFDPYDTRFSKIYKNCPISSHVRKANPRQRNGNQGRLIFRRGYLYSQEEFTGYPRSGILFISFQRDIGFFEDMKKNLTQHINKSSYGQSTNVKSYLDRKVLLNNKFDTLTLGGGYYFIPPIPNKMISEIGQQFFR